MVANAAVLTGRWNEATTRVDELLASGEVTPLIELGVRSSAAELRLARDDVAGAASECERALELARAQQDVFAPDTLRQVLCLRANIALAEGSRAAAHEYTKAALAVTVRIGGGAVDLALLLHDLDRPGDVVVEEASARPNDPWLEVAAAIARGELEQAAQRLAEMGAAGFEAAVRLRAAARLVEQGRRVEGDAQLRKALAFYRSVGATRYVREGEALLAATA